MPRDGEAPSGGWRSVYVSMGVSTSAEDDAAASPLGRRRAENARRSD